MATIAVSTLSFNSSAHTIACVQKLMQHGTEQGQMHKLQVFVADNGSERNDQLLLQQSLNDVPNVQHIQHTQNIGFAAGHNHNINLILQHGTPDYIWLLNNDCLVDERTLTELVNSAEEKPEVGIWGATILEPDGKTIQCAGGCFYSDWLTTFRQYGQGRPIEQLEELKEQNFDYLSGASLFFPTQVLQSGLLNPEGVRQQTAYLNEAFFLYFEELDLARRLKPEYKMAWSKQARVTHIGGSSTGTTGNQRSDSAEYHSSLSALKYTRIYYPSRLWIVAPLRYLLKCLQLSLKGRFRLLRPLTRAYRDFLMAR